MGKNAKRKNKLQPPKEDTIDQPITTTTDEWNTGSPHLVPELTSELPEVPPLASNTTPSLPPPTSDPSSPTEITTTTTVIEPLTETNQPGSPPGLLTKPDSPNPVEVVNKELEELPVSHSDEPSTKEASVPGVPSSPDTIEPTTEPITEVTPEVKAITEELTFSQSEDKTTTEELTPGQPEDKATIEELTPSRSEVKAITEELTPDEPKVKTATEEFTPGQPEDKAVTEELTPEQSEDKITTEELTRYQPKEGLNPTALPDPGLSIDSPSGSGQAADGETHNITEPVTTVKELVNSESTENQPLNYSPSLQDLSAFPSDFEQSQDFDFYLNSNPNSTPGTTKINPAVSNGSTPEVNFNQVSVQSSTPLAAPVSDPFNPEKIDSVPHSQDQHDQAFIASSVETSHQADTSSHPFGESEETSQFFTTDPYTSAVDDGFNFFDNAPSTQEDELFNPGPDPSADFFDNLGPTTFSDQGEKTLYNQEQDLDPRTLTASQRNPQYAYESGHDPLRDSLASTASGYVTYSAQRDLYSLSALPSHRSTYSQDNSYNPPSLEPTQEIPAQESTPNSEYPYDYSGAYGETTDADPNHQGTYDSNYPEYPVNAYDGHGNYQDKQAYDANSGYYSYDTPSQQYDANYDYGYDVNANPSHDPNPSHVPTDGTYNYDSNYTNGNYDYNGNYQYDPNAATGENYQYDPNAPTGENYQYDPNAVTGENYQYDPNAATGENHQYDPNAVTGENYQYDPSTATGGNYQYDLSTTTGENYQYDTNSITGENYHYDLNAATGENYQYGQNATTGETYQYDQNAIAGENYQYDQNATTEAYQYDQNATTAEAYQYNQNSKTGENYQYDPNATAGASYQYDQNAVANETYQYDPNAIAGENYQYDPHMTTGENYQHDPNTATAGDNYQFDTNIAPAQPYNYPGTENSDAYQTNPTADASYGYNDATATDSNYLHQAPAEQEYSAATDTNYNYGYSGYTEQPTSQGEPSQPYQADTAETGVDYGTNPPSGQEYPYEQPGATGTGYDYGVDTTTGQDYPYDQHNTSSAGYDYSSNAALDTTETTTDHTTTPYYQHSTSHPADQSRDPYQVPQYGDSNFSTPPVQETDPFKGAHDPGFAYPNHETDAYSEQSATPTGYTGLDYSGTTYPSGYHTGVGNDIDLDDLVLGPNRAGSTPVPSEAAATVPLPLSPETSRTPQNQEASAEMEARHGRPPCGLFHFGFGGKIFKMLPKSVERFSTTHSEAVTKVYPDRIHVDTLSTTPGAVPPALSAAKQGPLQSCQQAEEVIKVAIQILESEINSGYASDDTRATLLLWRILEILLKNGGNWEGSNEAISQALKLDFIQDLPLVAPSPDSAQPSSDLVLQLRQLLLQGSRSEAARLATQQGAWGHALIIASCAGKETWQETVNTFSRIHLSEPGWEGLNMAYNLFAGLGKNAVKEVMGQGNWYEKLALILSNRTAGDGVALCTLGDELLSSGLVSAAHVCYLLSPGVSIHGGLDAVGLRMVLVNASITSHLAYEFDAIRMTEVLEFALNQRSSSHDALPFLQAFKLNRAWGLIELGRLEEALEYCEAVMEKVNPHPSNKPYYHECLRSQLSSLADRIKYTSGTKGSDSAWLTKRPTLGSIMNAMEGHISQLVMGESDTPPPRMELQPGPTVFRSPITPNHLFTPQAAPFRRSASNERFVTNPGFDVTGRRSASPHLMTSPFAHNLTSTHTPSPLVPDTTDGLFNPMAGAPLLNTSIANTAPAVINPVSDDPIEDHGFGNARTSPRLKKTETPAESKASTPKPESESPGQASPGVLGSIWSSFFGAKSTDGKPVYKAKLGEENSFVYDPELKRWVNKAAGAPPPVAEAPPPPPPPSLPRPSPAQPPASAPPGMGGPPTPTGGGARAKKGAKNRYVDIFNS